MSYKYNEQKFLAGAKKLGKDLAKARKDAGIVAPRRTWTVIGFVEDNGQAFAVCVKAVDKDEAMKDAAVLLSDIVPADTPAEEIGFVACLEGRHESLVGIKWVDALIEEDPDELCNRKPEPA